MASPSLQANLGPRDINCCPSFDCCILALIARRNRSGARRARGMIGSESTSKVGRILCRVEDVYGRGARGEETGVNAGRKRGTDLRCFVRFSFAGSCCCEGFKWVLRVVIRIPREELPIGEIGNMPGCSCCGCCCCCSFDGRERSAFAMSRNRGSCSGGAPLWIRALDRSRCSL